MPARPNILLIMTDHTNAEALRPEGQCLTPNLDALVVGPDGPFVARSPSKARRPHMVTADLDIKALRRRRPGSTFAKHRADVYVAALSQ